MLGALRFVRLFLCLLLVAGVASLYFFPVALGFECVADITRLYYPPALQVGQNFEVRSDISITCTNVALDISARVELREHESNKTLSMKVIHIGYLDPRKPTTNFTAVNTAAAPSKEGIWRLAIFATIIAGGDKPVASAARSFQLQVGQLATTSTTTLETSQIQIQTTTTATGALDLGAFGLPVLAVVAFATVFVVFLKTRRKRPPSATEAQAVVQAKLEPARIEPPKAVRTSISTGYADLDAILAGGLPVGYAVLMLSPPCDEKDLLSRKIIGSALSTGSVVFFISRDLGRIQDLAKSYGKDFYAFSPQADKIVPTLPNIFKMAGVQNLNDVNISLSKSMLEILKEGQDRVIFLDILSDVLLEHHAVTTRKWLDDFISRRKVEGFTILGSLNPLLASKQEGQTIIDLFDGIIEIYERELRERTRRFLVVKKMYGRKYRETELMLDKDKLF